MNLALLDPFRRQIPDRIDSTLSLPRPFHPRRPRGSKGNSSSSKKNSNSTQRDDDDDAVVTSKTDVSTSTKKLRRKHSSVKEDSNIINDDEDDEDPFNDNNSNEDNSDEKIDLHEERNVWHSCFAVSFNRRGTHLAAGHASGAMGVHDFASRALSSIAHPPMMKEKKAPDNDAQQEKKDDSMSSIEVDITTASDANGGSSSGVGVDGDGNDNVKKNTHDDDTDPNIDTGTNTGAEITKPSHILLGSSQNKDSSRIDESTPKPSSTIATNNNRSRLFPNGITSSTWSRRSRVILVASYGDNHVCFVDNTHPYGPDDVSCTMIGDAASVSAAMSLTGASGEKDDSGTVRSSAPPLSPVGPKYGALTQNAERSGTISADEIDDDSNTDHLNPNKITDTNDTNSVQGKQQQRDEKTNEPILKRTRYVSKLEEIDPFKLTLPTDIDKLNASNSESAASDASVSTKLSSTLAHLMTPREKEIDLKANWERTMEERHIHALMKMRLDGSLKKKKKKKKGGASGSGAPSASMGAEISDLSSGSKRLKTSPSLPTDWYQNIVLALPRPLHYVQIHPNGLGGLACLDNGSLALFGLSTENSFRVEIVKGKTEEQQDQQESSSTRSSSTNKGNLFYLVPSSQVKNEKFVTCATFDPRGNYVYAATRCGTLLGFKMNSELEFRLFGRVVSSKKDAMEQGTLFEARKQLFERKIPGGASVHQIVCSRNGSMLLVNSKDNVLRLYETKAMWDSIQFQKQVHQASPKPFQPRFSFQDVVSRCKWASCDFSGDGEFVVGGCNNVEGGDKYELYLWNTATGYLLDQLTGPQISLYSLSWHPTRSFIAVGTSDGFVDIWGPRMDWTAFAPDFQALQKNVEYIEKEDEFDVVVDGDEDEIVKRKQLSERKEEQELVDVTTNEPIPAFDSDSECEEDVFYFNTKIRPNYSGKQGLKSN